MRKFILSIAGVLIIGGLYMLAISYSKAGEQGGFYGILSGSLSILAIIIGVVIYKKTNKNIQDLKNNGYKISAKIDYVLFEKYLSGWSNSGVSTVFCKGLNPVTKQERVFKSESVPYYRLLIGEVFDKKIDVYIDKNKTTNYFVEVSKIPLGKKLGFIPDGINFWQLLLGSPPIKYISYDGINYKKLENKDIIHE